ESIKPRAVQAVGRANLSAAATQESFSTCNRYMKGGCGCRCGRPSAWATLISVLERQSFMPIRRQDLVAFLGRAAAAWRVVWISGRDPKLKLGSGRRPSKSWNYGAGSRG